MSVIEKLRRAKDDWLHKASCSDAKEPQRARDSKAFAYPQMLCLSEKHILKHMVFLKNGLCLPPKWQFHSEDWKMLYQQSTLV
jgi:hypothetical protein